jgi:hypothetical protein
LEDPGVDARIIVKWIFEKSDASTDWIDLAEVGAGGRIL